MNRRTLAARLRRWRRHLRVRRQPALVLWSGRLDDRLAGSPEDLRLAELERTHSRRLALAFSRLAAVGARQTRLAGALGISTRQATDAINELGRELDRYLERSPSFVAARDAALAGRATRRRDAAELAQIIGAAPIGRPHRFADLELDHVPGARTR